MTWTSRCVLVAIVSVVLTGMPRADEPAKAIRWEDVAKAQKLSNKDIELLKQNRFVITGEPFKQVFTPYLGSDVPVFITTDSLLNGFHVLFEESIYRLEQAQARKLPAILEGLSKELDKAVKSFRGEAELIDAARKRATIILGVARSLLDGKPPQAGAPFKAEIQEEVSRIIEAKKKLKPAWLGRPDPGFLAIDYSRFLPRGFYTKSLALQRYFRAVSWLQAIPFRLDIDEELAAFFLLSRANRDPEQKVERKSPEFWNTYRDLLGGFDDWDLLSATELPKLLSPVSLDLVRKEYKKKAEWANGPAINDQLRFAPSQPDGKFEIAFRFLSASRIPDGVLFQRTMNPNLAKRDFPTGLELCAALGSSFARDKLGKEQPKVLKEIEASRRLFKDESLYAEYLRCLGVLLERTEHDAPALFHSAAWKRKTCQTALSGWGQMRHTWALQAKQGAYYIGGVHSPAGFVEPVPEFYGLLAKLVGTTHRILNQAGALTRTDEKDRIKELLHELQEAQTIFKKVRHDKKGLNSLTQDEMALLAQFDPDLNDRDAGPENERHPEQVLDRVERMLDAYRNILEGGERGSLHLMGFDLIELPARWTQLSERCHELEILAHKQLRQVPFSDTERASLMGYGKELAGIMLYAGNSYLSPRDDAPRIIDIFSNSRAGKYLHVGIARPRTLWVVYPFKGVETLCRGAVMPYHEFAHSGRLTDAAWKSLLDSPQRPQTPAWIQPITAPEETHKPKKEK